MKSTIWTGTCSAIIVSAAISLAAQTPVPPQTPANPPPPSAAASADRVVVTGCLAAAPATSASATSPTAAGTTGTAGAPVPTGTTGTADQKFVLTNATASTAPASPDASATTPPPAASASAAPEAKRTYQLIANASALSPHVGKKVELTGTLESQSASAAATPTDPASADSNAPVLRVQSGKIIAASCSE